MRTNRFGRLSISWVNRPSWTSSSAVSFDSCLLMWFSDLWLIGSLVILSFNLMFYPTTNNTRMSFTRCPSNAGNYVLLSRDKVSIIPHPATFTMWLRMMWFVHGFVCWLLFNVWCLCTYLQTFIYMWLCLDSLFVNNNWIFNLDNVLVLYRKPKFKQ